MLLRRGWWARRGGSRNLAAVMISSLAAYVLAATFAWAGLAKVLAFGRWRNSLQGYGLGPAVRRVAAGAVPVAELGAAALLVTASPTIGAALALALLAAFSGAILVAARERGSRLPCGCFGGAKERDYRWLLVRNGALALVAAIVLLGRELRPGMLDGPIEAVPLALSILGALAICWTVWQVFSSLRGRRHP